MGNFSIQQKQNYCLIGTIGSVFDHLSTVHSWYSGGRGGQWAEVCPKKKLRQQGEKAFFPLFFSFWFVLNAFMYKLRYCTQLY